MVRQRLAQEQLGETFGPASFWRIWQLLPSKRSCNQACGTVAVASDVLTWIVERARLFHLNVEKRLRDFAIWSDSDVAVDRRSDRLTFLLEDTSWSFKTDLRNPPVTKGHFGQIVNIDHDCQC
jgi:hypothetical protein